MTTHPALVALLAAAALSLAGCGDDAATDDASPTTAPIEEPTVAAGDGEDGTSPTTEGPTSTSAAEAATTTTLPGLRVEVEVAGGEVVGGPPRVEVPLGEEVTVAVTADVADEVHVHGYDVLAATGAGATTEVTFMADIPGVFEVELEEAGLPLAILVVS